MLNPDGMLSIASAEHNTLKATAAKYGQKKEDKIKPIEHKNSKKHPKKPRHLYGALGRQIERCIIKKGPTYVKVVQSFFGNFRVHFKKQHVQNPTPGINRHNLFSNNTHQTTFPNNTLNDAFI